MMVGQTSAKHGRERGCARCWSDSAKVGMSMVDCLSACNVSRVMSLVRGKDGTRRVPSLGFRGKFRNEFEYRLCVCVGYEVHDLVSIR